MTTNKERSISALEESSHTYRRSSTGHSSFGYPVRYVELAYAMRLLHHSNRHDIAAHREDRPLSETYSR